MSQLRLFVPTLLVALAMTGGLMAPANAHRGVPTLVDIRAAHHPGFDRIVFDFAGPLPDPRWRVVRWAKKVRPAGSSIPYNLHGNAFLEVTFGAAATAKDGELTYADPERAFALPNLNHMVSAGDFEKQVTIGLGLMRRTRILREFTLVHPNRWVIDVAADFPQAWARVHFVDEANFDVGAEPAVRPVLRRVPTPDVARGALLRMYAGPTAAERGDRLSLVTSILPPRSEAPDRTGFRRLRIEVGVAHVTLTGRCSSGGSTITVANLIEPTLRQWPTVDHVKIYDARGRTSRPHGPGDSRPLCLEP